jgi:hypothetical protein
VEAHTAYSQAQGNHAAHLAEILDVSWREAEPERRVIAWLRRFWRWLFRPTPIAPDDM